jgi:LuxR family quorum-sensing transcriptional regulator LasR
MNYFEQFSELTNLTTLESWRDKVSQFGENFGYEHFGMGFFDERSKAAPYFFLTNYPATWCEKYAKKEMASIDPVFPHCLTKSTPFIWAPDSFSGKLQKEFYEEACSCGIRTGLTLPVHGSKNEFGLVNFATDAKPDKAFLEHTTRHIPELSCLRDFIFETSKQFTKPCVLPDEEAISFTKRELECLKWSASGKSSWDIAYIMNCTESGVNSHFSRIREKLGVSTRRQAIVKAIRLQIINPA